MKKSCLKQGSCKILVDLLLMKNYSNPGLDRVIAFEGVDTTNMSKDI